MNRIDPPKEVIYIIDVLSRHGHDAYAVGGCIRDSVMGSKPKDWDIATSAYPDEVKALFDKTLDTGLRHGTVTVMTGGGSYEVTTFRIDGRYEDGRHPEYVEFTGMIEDDLARRDFTINAMAWNARCGIIDPFGGMSDIEAGIIRTVGSPQERFSEDALRMLRAVRFAARLGFVIESSTLDAIKSSSHLIKKISAERIREELTGILTSDDPAGFMLLADTGVLGQILEKFGYSCAVTMDFWTENCPRTGNSLWGGSSLWDGISTKTAGIKYPDGFCLSAVGAVEADVCLRWAALFRCFAVFERTVRHPQERVVKNVDGEKDAKDAKDTKEDESFERFLAVVKDILTKLKFSNKYRDKILKLLEYADMSIEPVRGDVASAAACVGEDVFEDLLKLKRATISMQERKNGSGNNGDIDDIEKTGSENHRLIDEIEKIYRDLISSDHCLKLKDLAVNGHDLIRLGFIKGSDVGNGLSYLLDRVIAEPGLNRKEILEKLALDYLEERL